MSQHTDEMENDDLPQVSELDSLKERAKLMGIKFHPAIGVDALKAKIDEKINGKQEEAAMPQDEPEEAPMQEQINAPISASVAAPSAKETPAQKRNRLKKQANELVRVRVTCMNPNKKDWEGEVITAGNTVVGSFKKYIPFDNPEGWHVPRIILNAMRERKCQVFYWATHPNNGHRYRKGRLINEFAIEELPALTTEQLQDLARRQAMARGTAEA